MNILTNPKYEKILKKIKPLEKSKDLFEAINIIESNELNDEKLTNSKFKMVKDTDKKKIKIQYYIDKDGLIIKGSLIVDSKGNIIKVEKDVEDLIEDIKSEPSM